MTGPRVFVDSAEEQISLKDRFEAAQALGYDYLIQTQYSGIICPYLNIYGEAESTCLVKTDEPLPRNLKNVSNAPDHNKIFGIYDLSMDFEAASEAKYHVPLPLAKALRTEILEKDKILHRWKMSGRPLLERLFKKPEPAPTLENTIIDFD